MSVKHSEVMTFVVSHKVREGHDAEYEAWLGEIGEVAKSYAGHLGTNIIRPHSGQRDYTIVIRFEDIEKLTAWVESEDRAAYITKIEHVLETGDQFRTEAGIDYWFTPPTPEAKRAKAWKQFLITLSAIYPLTLVVPLPFKPLLAAYPWMTNPFIINFFVATIIVYLMVYVIMPRYTKAVAKWLFR